MLYLLGATGLLAFLVYDNSESFVYIALSGIMKTMSPIVTVFHKEMDFKAVQYIISKSLKQVLMLCVPIGVLFFIYPELLVKLFNVTGPYYAHIVSIAIRITSFGLIGRCVSYLLANYAQAIEENGITLGITLLEEFLISILGALILTHFIGGIGIWIAILLSETIPVLLYVVVTIFQKSQKKEINGIFMLQDSNLMNFTYAKEFSRSSEGFLRKFKDNSSLVFSSIEDVCEHIFQHDSSVSEIDITILLIKDDARILFIDAENYIIRSIVKNYLSLKTLKDYRK